jgi:hypothetical protein
MNKKKESFYKHKTKKKGEGLRALVGTRQRRNNKQEKGETLTIKTNGMNKKRGLNFFANTKQR